MSEPSRPGEDMSPPHTDEVDRGNFATAGIAVGGLGTFGVLLGALMTLTGLGDARIVEGESMLVTGLVLAVVGSALWWQGRPD